MIVMRPVESSMISAVGYDEAKEILCVRFSRGGEYDYHGVAKEEHDALMKSESIGKHFHKHIRGKYDGIKREDG